MKQYMYHFCYEYNMIYLFYVPMIIVCPSKGSVVEHYNTQSSGCEEKPNAHDSGPNFKSIRNLSAVFYPLLRTGS